MSFIQQQSISALDQKERLLEGWLKKKSPRGIFAKVWQKRFFVVYDDVVQYFKKKSDINPAGIIPLQAVSDVTRDMSKKNGCRFDITVGEKDTDNFRTFCLLAETDAECDNWVSKIRELVKGYRQEGQETLDIDTSQPKYWKNTREIAEARRSTTWGDRPYLMSAEEAAALVNDESTNSGGLMPSTTTPLASDVIPFELVKQLTDGPFGRYYAAKQTSTGLLHLMHVFDRSDPQIKIAEQLFTDMGKLVHPYIFQQVHRGETADTIFAVYTYAIDQSLFVHLRNHRRFPELVARFFAAEIVLAIGYAHKQQRQLSTLGPENIFLDEDGHAVVTDFLLSLAPTWIPTESETPEYATPEKLSGVPTDRRSDWWRLGVLLYELMVGFPPFRSHDPTELAAKITAHTAETLRFPPFISAEGIDLIQSLLHVDPAQRLGASEEDFEAVMRHPWFAAINWPELERRHMDSPDWVADSLQDAAAHAANATAREYAVEVQVLEARNLPALRANGTSSDPYCRIQCNGVQHKTSIESDTVTPRWEQTFDFDINNGTNGELVVSVFHEDPNQTTDPNIGSVTVPLIEIKDSRKQTAWWSIIGSDSLAHGEVRLALTWGTRLTRTVIEPPTQSELAFDDLFSTADLPPMPPAES